MAAAMRRQGVSGVFAYGKCYGIILGILTARAVPYTLAMRRGLRCQSRAAWPCHG
jgi:hypothetical protein